MLGRYYVTDTDWTILNGRAPASCPAVQAECFARKRAHFARYANLEPQIADAFVGDLD
jgi:hypothetical protein